MSLPIYFALVVANFFGLVAILFPCARIRNKSKSGAWGKCLMQV